MTARGLLDLARGQRIALLAASVGMVLAGVIILAVTEGDLTGSLLMLFGGVIFGGAVADLVAVRNEEHHG